MKSKSFTNSASWMVSYIHKTAAWADTAARVKKTASSILAHGDLTPLIESPIYQPIITPPQLSKRPVCGRTYRSRIGVVGNDSSGKKISKYKIAQGSSASSGGLCLVASLLNSVTVWHSSCRIGNAVSLYTIIAWNNRIIDFKHQNINQ